jgi:hypothetical protein
MKKTINQKGNVLFLILIAVALFAALSYAVTQSSRSGGDASRETNILNAAQLTQYPTSIRTAVLRLIIDGFQDTNILYASPGNIITNSPSEPWQVFATIGGGAIHQNAPTDMMQAGGANAAGAWFINMNFEVPELGRTTIPGIAGNELIAFLPGITESVCTRINLEANIIASSAVANPVLASTVLGAAADDADFNITLLSHYNSAGNRELDTTGNHFTRQPFGCFEDSSGSGTYVLYTVILER